jgi:TRAP-type mannitol/chloroaromatic compound transport system permease large subunit
VRFALILAVLASILAGVATPTEAASVGALGFVTDAFEIIFVVVPIVAPVLLQMPGVLGPTLFYLRGAGVKRTSAG